jgi:ribose transport system substrate-binding protein
MMLPACDRDGGGGGGPGTTQQAKQYKIGFANIGEDFPFPVRVREGIEKAAREAGNIELIVADNKMDGATARANAQNFLTKGVHGVIEFQTDEEAGPVIMEKFKERNIPVIAIDIPMPGAVFFGVDNHKAGHMAGRGLGEWVKKNWGGKVDALLMLELPQSGKLVQQRLQGQRDGLEAIVGKIDESKVKHIATNNTLADARPKVANALTTLPDARHLAVVCINDDTAMGAIAAAEASGRADQVAVVAVGADEQARREMRKAKTPMVGSTASFPEKYGEKIIPLMLKMLKGEQVPESVYTDHVFITPENLEQYYPGATDAAGQ